MKRDALRALCRKFGVAQSGSDADIVERLVSKYDEIAGTPADDAEAMDSDVHYAFAFSGFPQDSNELEAVQVIKEHVHDYLSEFSVTIVGSCAAKGQIAMTFLASEGEALLAQIHEHRDRFAYRGTVLTTVAVDSLELGSFRMPTPSSSSVGLPSGVPVLPGGVPVPPGAAPFPTPPMAPGTSPLLASPYRRLVQRVVEDVPPPGFSSEIPSNPHGVDPWVSELLGSVRDIKEYMRSHMVTREQFDKYHVEQAKYIASTVEAALNPVHEEISMLKTRVLKLESSPSVQRSASVQPRGADPAFKQLAFTKVSREIDADERIKKVEAFFDEHFPHVRVKDVQNVYSGPFSNRKLTTAVLVEVSNSDVHRAVLEKIEAKRWKCTIGGQDVAIKKALTQTALQRNAALRRAEKVLKEHAIYGNKVVKIEWKDKRGVSVDGTYAFIQDKVEVVGKFIAPFGDLSLPP